MVRSLAAQIYKGMKAVSLAGRPLFLDAVLTRDVVPSSPAYDAFDPPAPVATDYACKAIVETYSDYLRSNGMVGAKDRKVLILSQSISTRPAADDRVTISSVTFTILEVQTDPAEAVWVCRGRM